MNNSGESMIKAKQLYGVWIAFDKSRYMIAPDSVHSAKYVITFHHDTTLSSPEYTYFSRNEMCNLIEAGRINYFQTHPNILSLQVTIEDKDYYCSIKAEDI